MSDCPNYQLKIHFVKRVNLQDFGGLNGQLNCSILFVVMKDRYVSIRDADPADPKKTGSDRIRILLRHVFDV